MNNFKYIINILSYIMGLGQLTEKVFQESRIGRNLMILGLGGLSLIVSQALARNTKKQETQDKEVIEWVLPQETYKVVFPFKEPETKFEKRIYNQLGDDVKYMMWKRKSTDFKMALALSNVINNPGISAFQNVIDKLIEQRNHTEYVPLEDMEKYNITKSNYQGTIDPTRTLPQPVFYQQTWSGDIILLEKGDLLLPETSISVPPGMVYVKGGIFDMGDVMEDNEIYDEIPLHKEEVGDFYIDIYEVTQAEFTRVMGYIPGIGNSEELPAEGIHWPDADEYCRRVGKRLPTEAEWEYAARERGEKVRFGNGKNIIGMEDANFCYVGQFSRFYPYYIPSRHSDLRFGVVPVGSYPPNALGLYDMTGNVEEWVSDWFYNRFNKKVYVLKGGSYTGNPAEVRATSHMRDTVVGVNSEAGCRCVKDR
ncbi:hypothetical protein CEE44_02480 [Candidatus Woesearchaeota archaeon B3_Woes]|nr:MAG: hypothetical protein CEE44_02480 [Candidatus Woesearchaeota archaeon B3_Woes]